MTDINTSSGERKVSVPASMLTQPLKSYGGYQATHCIACGVQGWEGQWQHKPECPVNAQPAAPAEVVATLQARIDELEAELLPYKEAEAESLRRAQRRDRAESIANALFPRYDSVYARRHPEEKPPQWHEKSWWWNGVSVDFDESDIYDAYGTASLSLSSYVGGGETDTTVVKFPAQWLEADSLVEPIAAFVAEKLKERETQKAAKEAAEAQRQIEAAKETLRRLTGGAA